MSECHDNSTQRQPKLPGSQPSVIHPDPCHLGLSAQIRAEWTDPGIQGKFSAWWSFCLLGWGVLLANRILDSQVAAECGQILKCMVGSVQLLCCLGVGGGVGALHSDLTTFPLRSCCLLSFIP